MLKPRFIKTIILVILFFDCPPIFSEGGDNSIVVFDFIISGDFSSSVKNTLTETFIEELKKTGNFEITEISERDKVLSKLGTQPSITVDEEKRRKTGQLLNIKKIFSGTVWKLGEVTQISLQIIDAETGKTDVTMKIGCKCTTDGLYEQVKILARRVAGLPDDWEPEKSANAPQEMKKSETSGYEKESLSVKLMRYEEEKKSVFGAWALSFFIGFGSGNFYGGNPKSGIFFLATELAGLALIGQSDFDSVALGILTFMLLRQVDWIYAIYGTSKYNEELMKKILTSRTNFYPYLSLAGNTPVYGFGLRF